MTGREQTARSVLLVFLLCTISVGASSYNGQTCSGDKPTANSTYCTSISEPVNASECQAVENYPVRLVCSVCSSGITWQRWNGAKWKTIAGTQQVLEYPADTVVPSLAGCFQCWCYHSSQGGYASVVFSMDVKSPEPPKLLMNNTSEGNGEFILDPVTVHLVVNQQMLCFPFTSTGYPDVEYEMYYKVSEEGDYLPVTANQSCLVQSGDSLSYIPPVRTSSQIGNFMSVVHNLVGNITVFQTVSYNADPIWPIKPHPAQTSGNVTIDHNSGVGKAVCAAYQEDPDVTLLYFLCPIPNGMTAEEAACLYNRMDHNLTCYPCGSVGVGFNSTYISSVSDLGIETSSCSIEAWEEGLFVCLAQRQWMDGRKSIYQQIGNFTTSKPEPQPTPQPIVCKWYTPLHYGLIAVVAFLVIVIFVGCVCVCLCRWAFRKVCSLNSKLKHKDGYIQIEKVHHESADKHVRSDNASDVDESTPLKKMFTSLFTKVNKPKPDQAISVHLLHAASGVELTDRCQPMVMDSACSWNLYRLDLELGVSYNLQVQSGSEILTVISITTPGIVEPREPLPHNVDAIVPLTSQALMPFISGLAADYEVIGILLGQGDLVGGIRNDPGSASQKMVRILDEWTGTEEASWSALMKALESYTPRLRSVASGIRLFLTRELEKANGHAVSQKPSNPPRLEAADDS